MTDSLKKMLPKTLTPKVRWWHWSRLVGPFRRWKEERLARHEAEIRLSKFYTFAIIQFTYGYSDTKQTYITFYVHCQKNGKGERYADVRWSGDGNYKDDYKKHSFYVKYIVGWLGGRYDDNFMKRIEEDQNTKKASQ